jgi:RNA 2',3'-cyclic 3'-phosphodiesterase
VSEPRERLFVGVPLPEGLKALVREAQQALPRTNGLRLLPETQWHVTLAFLGEVEPDAGFVARKIVEAVPPEMGGTCRLGGLLMLPSAGKARVAALAIDDYEGAFAQLYEVIMSSLETAGVMEREKRPFRPHLTVARVRTPGPVRPRSDVEPVRFAVESVCLYKSELRREGAVYTVLARRVFNKRRRSKG